MKIRENYDVIIEKHPYAESLKEKLIAECRGPDKRPNDWHTNIVGNKIAVDESPNAPSKIIKNWVVSILTNTYPSINMEKIRYDIGMWFASYDKGNYVKVHNHLPFAVFSWVYFINSPRGSSPLVFTTTGKRIKAEEGKVVIFPSFMMHHVPKNKCDNRIVMAGNALPYRPSMVSK